MCIWLPHVATTSKRCCIHVDKMQGESSCPHVVCTPDRLTDGEASLIADDKSENEWNPRLDKSKESQLMPARSIQKRVRAA